MVKLLRVDDRLLHGQVAFSWVNYSKVKRIIVANDEAATNSMLKMSLTLGKPPGVDLKIVKVSEAIDLINNSDCSKTLVITKTIPDAYMLCSSCNEISDICIGGVREEAGKKLVYNSVYLNSDEAELIDQMLKNNKNVFAQEVPITKALTGSELIKKFKGE